MVLLRPALYGIHPTTTNAYSVNCTHTHTHIDFKAVKEMRKKWVIIYKAKFKVNLISDGKLYSRREDIIYIWFR